MLAMPVTLPPGRASVPTKPSAIGSSAADITMGTVVVASRAARMATGPRATMTSTPRRTRFAVTVASWPALPSPYTYSITTVAPGSQPSSRRPRSNGPRCTAGASVALPGLSTATCGTRPAGCASTMTGAARARAPSVPRNWRRVFMPLSASARPAPA